MRPPISRALFYLLQSWLLIALAGCGPALVSQTLERADSLGCKYEAGAYALPLDLISIEIRKKEDDDPQYYFAPKVDVVRTADPKRIYCLDFLASALSADKIAIGRGNDGLGSSSLLLTEVGSSFDDKSLEIASEIVKAGARLAVKPRGGFSTNEKDALESVVAQFDFDPFDKAQIEKVNRALKPLRHCIFLDPTNDPYVPDWHAGLCEGYKTGRSVANDGYYGLSVIQKNPPPASPKLQGILYRPQLTHKLVLMRRNEKPVGSAWQIFETKRVQMTNAAPAFMLEVNRSAFVTRTMSIKFNGGVLTSVEINKPSEAEKLSEFVLSTVQVIVSVPVRALIIGKTDAQNRENLIKAQARLISTLREYDAAVELERKKRQDEADQQGQQPTRSRAAPVNVATVGDGSDLDECINANASLQDVSAYCQEVIQSGGQIPE